MVIRIVFVWVYKFCAQTTNENNSFSIILPSHYQNKANEKTIDDLNKLLELKSLELHVEEVRKRGNITKNRR